MPGLFARLHRLRPTRPRSPLLRIGFALLGVALLLVLLVGGVFIGLGMLAFRAVQRLMRARKAKAAGDVLEAEYRVVAPRAVPHAR
ncbi:hypothetical protein GCM10028794_03130 [Silanimonas algicola]